MDIRPDYANLKTTAGLQRVSPETVRIGDRIVVKPGDKIPLDGMVVDGLPALDTSALTGESLPRDVEPGSSALSLAVLPPIIIPGAAFAEWINRGLIFLVIW